MRPQALARNLESVATQTAVEHIEQYVFPDHVGYGWDAMYGRVMWYAPVIRGKYVAWLNDDDMLSSRTVVESLMRVAARRQDPDIIVVKVRKGILDFPKDNYGWPPTHGNVDLGNYVIRKDVFLAHTKDYGHRYEGDFDHAAEMYLAGRKAVLANEILFAEGPASGGRPEVDWR
jgi:hypothetical protein